MARRDEIPAEIADQLDDFPALYGYCQTKAKLFLKIGPKIYRSQDALGQPPAEIDAEEVADIEKGCRALLEWKGLVEDAPIEGIQVAGFYGLMRLFHCGTMKEMSNHMRGPGILDKMIVRHQVNGWEMILFNRVVYED
jgi:hypothetical protein